MRDLTSLYIGETATIAETIENIPLKLVEMGCLPGSSVTLMQVAPLNDPIYVNVNGSHIAIRKAMAKQIKIVTS